VSEPTDPGAGDPFGGIPFFGDLARMIQQQGPVSWDAARQLAASIATEGNTEPNVDPVARIQLEQLGRVAELQVAQATGLTPSPGGAGITILPVNRSQWTARSMDALRPLFEALAGSLSGNLKASAEGMAGGEQGDDIGGDPIAAMFSGLMQMLGPMMLGMTAGSMLGHLARRSFGQYDLPIPRPASEPLMIVVPNLEEFGSEWTLPADDLRLWVCLHEVTHHAVLSVPHVRARLDSMLLQYVSGFEADPTALEQAFGELEVSDPSAFGDLQRVLGDPELLLGAIRSPAQLALLPPLEALGSVIVGYVDHIMDSVGHGLIGSYGMLTEALRRRRVTADPSDRFVERLLGLELTQAAYARGSAFVAGVVERAGTSALERLWAAEADLPTPPEVDAPGLWLARIGIDFDLPPDATDFPDPPDPTCPAERAASAARAPRPPRSPPRTRRNNWRKA
jgi:putative hydrolase